MIILWDILNTQKIKHGHFAFLQVVSRFEKTIQNVGENVIEIPDKFPRIYQKHVPKTLDYFRSYSNY